ncbi:MAG: PAS domain S-box protein [Candidatus Helarchaeota archaeon]
MGNSSFEREQEDWEINNFFQQVIKKNVDGIIIADQSKRILFINPAATELLNWRGKSTLGKKLNYRIKVGKQINYEMKKGNEIKKVLQIYTDEIQWKEEVLYILTIRDITEQKELEERLRNEKNFVETILETANSIIVGLDSGGNILFFNKMGEKITGCNQAEVIGKNWFDLFIIPDIKEKIQSVFRQTLQRGKSNYINKIKTKFEDRYIWWHNATVRRRKEVFVVAIGIDITEEERARQKIKDLNEWLRLIIHILGHDILNDFQYMLLALEVFQKQKDDTICDKVVEKIERSMQFIKKMQKLEMLVSRGENLKPINLKKVLEKVLEEYIDSKVDIELNLNGNCVVLADDAINSVFDNLIENAIIHGRTDKIEIIAEPKRKYYHVQVIDYGVGIPKEIRHRLFVRGAKAGKTGNKGIGLFLVKSIIESYGGKISAENNEPNGTKFYIKLLRADN